MLCLTLREDFDSKTLETGGLCLGYKEISLLFNVGPWPGGGDCLIVCADGELLTINSNDLIHDIQAYQMRNS